MHTQVDDLEIAGATLDLRRKCRWLQLDIRKIDNFRKNKKQKGSEIWRKSNLHILRLSSSVSIASRYLQIVFKN